jgi:Sec-independent protein translocase protein TatA
MIHPQTERRAVFLGPKHIPEAGRALGQGLKEFKNSITGSEDGL